MFIDPHDSTDFSVANKQNVKGISSIPHCITICLG